MSRRKKILRKPIDRIQADPRQGLTASQAQQNYQAGWYNRSVKAGSKSVWQIIRDNLFTYFNLIFLILTILVCLVRSYNDLTFLVVIVINILIGTIQEIRAKRALDKITVLNAPTARVIRDGQEQVLNAEDLVLDDIVHFGPGEQICADAVVVEGEASVNEALLTGESDEIKKGEGSPLLSGSFIVSGSCYARLDKVGEDSYISRLTLEAREQKSEEESEMVRSLDKLVRAIGIILIPIGLILFVQSAFFSDNSVQTSVQSTVASVIGMIPEGLFLLVSMTLAISAARLAGKKVLVHNMKCIETLARVDVLCVDKTGTITGNEMKVSSVYPILPLSYQYSEKEGTLEGLLSDFARGQAADNITMSAVKEYFDNPAGQEILSHTGFSSEFKYSSTTLSSGSYVLGAPEFILHEKYGEFQNLIEDYGKKGYRVLVFGRYDGTPDGQALTGDVTPYCLVLLTNPIRPNAPETFRYFEKQGVAIKVISGDNPVTVSEVARKAKIRDAEKYVDASALKTEEDIAQAVEKYTVFGRVTPDQKRAFVQALKSSGHTVAMTGDGVNDILAMKDADCSVAMGSGSDAAAQSAQLVLLESDFSRMPDVVAEGRRAVNNLERSGILFLWKNVFSFLMSILAILFAFTYPVTPSQISLISLFDIGIPAFFLSLMPNKERIRGRYISNVLEKAAPAGLAATIIIAVFVVVDGVIGASSGQTATACTVMLAIVGLEFLFEISRPMSFLKWLNLIFCLVCLIGAFILVPNLFDLQMVSMHSVIMWLVFGVSAKLLLNLSFKITGYIRKNWKWLRRIWRKLGL